MTWRTMGREGLAEICQKKIHCAVQKSVHLTFLAQEHQNVKLFRGIYYQSSPVSDESAVSLHYLWATDFLSLLDTISPLPIITPTRPHAQRITHPLYIIWRRCLMCLFVKDICSRSKQLFAKCENFIAWSSKDPVPMPVTWYCHAMSCPVKTNHTLVGTLETLLANYSNQQHVH